MIGRRLLGQLAIFIYIPAAMLMPDIEIDIPEERVAAEISKHVPLKKKGLTISEMAIDLSDDGYAYLIAKARFSTAGILAEMTTSSRSQLELRRGKVFITKPEALGFRLENNNLSTLQSTLVQAAAPGIMQGTMENMIAEDKPLVDMNTLGLKGKIARIYMSDLSIDEEKLVASIAPLRWPTFVLWIAFWSWFGLLSSRKKKSAPEGAV